MYNTIFHTAVTANDSTAKEQLGAIRWEYSTTYGWRCYKYVQAASDTTVANGTALAYTDYTRTVVSSDRDDTNANWIAGVGVGAITASYYGWIQIKGYHSVVATDAGDDIAIGDALILHASTDGVVDCTAAGTAPVTAVLGWAYAADVD
ncbi:MAG: hypothetical protein PHH57_08005, partial [Candidatus Omnitrophica bacterium]|nr:hypothetical protein [Candidatus Omnitrophota bacterium]